MSAASVPMTPEGFGAMISRHVASWGRKAVAVVKTGGRFIARVANRLRITPAARWVASTSKVQAKKAWVYAKPAVTWAITPLTALWLGYPYVVLGAGFILAGSFFAVRSNRKDRDHSPEEWAEMQSRWRAAKKEHREELSRLHMQRRKNEISVVVDPDFVNPEDAIVVEENVPGDVIADELQKELDELREEVRELRAGLAEVPPVEDDVVVVPDPEEPQMEFPAEVEKKHLPVPYPILQERWTNLAGMSEEADEAQDNELYSELIGRMSVVLARTGNPENKLKPDAAWNKIHAENRKQQEAEQPRLPVGLDSDVQRGSGGGRTPEGAGRQGEG